MLILFYFIIIVFHVIFGWSFFCLQRFAYLPKSLYLFFMWGFPRNQIHIKILVTTSHSLNIINDIRSLFHLFAFGNNFTESGKFHHWLLFTLHYLSNLTFKSLKLNDNVKNFFTLAVSLLSCSIFGDELIFFFAAEERFVDGEDVPRMPRWWFSPWNFSLWELFHFFSFPSSETLFFGQTLWFLL